MEQSPLPFTVRIRIRRCCGDLAVTYAEKKISDDIKLSKKVLMLAKLECCHPSNKQKKPQKPLLKI